MVLCAIPFGVGQFANDNFGKGVAFATSEVLFLGLNIGLYWSQVAACNKPGGCDNNSSTYVLQNVFFGLFITTAIAGVIDAYLFP